MFSEELLKDSNDVKTGVLHSSRAGASRFLKAALFGKPVLSRTGRDQDAGSGIYQSRKVS